MTKKIIAALLSACIALGVCFLPSSSTSAQNNDAKYDNYVNMHGNTTGHAKYIVPNLYRQDASYINVKTFPLVVNGSVEYFPLDIFALYPYLQVVYSKLTEGFYINNTKNNHYVAFDMETGTTTTHDSQLQDIGAKIFNRTYYVPAAEVCSILGMKFETYDDPINGIRAARISDDKAKMTLNQLVTVYSPVKKENTENSGNNSDESVDNKDSKPNDAVKEDEKPQKGTYDNDKNDKTEDKKDNGKEDDTVKNETDDKKEDEKTTVYPINPLAPNNAKPKGDGKDNKDGKTEDENGDGDDVKEDSDDKSEEEKPEPEPADPFETTSERSVHLAVEVEDFSVAGKIIDMLNENGVTAVFYVDEGDVLSSPDTMRHIVMNGHKPCIDFNVLSEEGNVMDNDTLFSRISEINDALYLVTKTKTRFVRIPDDYRDVFEESGFFDEAKTKGFTVCSKTINASDGEVYKRDQLERLTEDILGEDTTLSGAHLVKFGTYEGTDELISAFIGFTKKYPKFILRNTDEFTDMSAFDNRN